MKFIKSHPVNEKLKSFLDDIIIVCKKHKLSISHEDIHGSFIVEPYSDTDIEWLKDAYFGLGIVDE